MFLIYIYVFYPKTPSFLYFKTQRFGNWIMSPSSGKIFMMDNVQKHIICTNISYVLDAGFTCLQVYYY
jgi:hypothetical protein